MGRKEKKATFRGKGYPTALKVRIAQEVVEKGRTVYEVAKALGLNASSVKEWALRYEARGAAGLERTKPKPPDAPRVEQPKTVVQEAVERVKAENPQAGTRRIVRSSGWLRVQR